MNSQAWFVAIRHATDVTDVVAGTGVFVHVVGHLASVGELLRADLTLVLVLQFVCNLGVPQETGPTRELFTALTAQELGIGVSHIDVVSEITFTAVTLAADFTRWLSHHGVCESVALNACAPFRPVVAELTEEHFTLFSIFIILSN